MFRLWRTTNTPGRLLLFYTFPPSTLAQAIAQADSLNKIGRCLIPCVIFFVVEVGSEVEQEVSV